MALISPSTSSFERMLEEWRRCWPLLKPAVERGGTHGAQDVLELILQQGHARPDEPKREATKPQPGDYAIPSGSLPASWREPKPQGRTNEEDPAIQVQLTVRRKLTAGELARLVQADGDLSVIMGAILTMRLAKLVQG